MTRVLLPLIVLAYPLVEIAGFVVVGSRLGVLATIALVIATGLAGAVLLRWQGFGVLSRIRRDVDAGRDPSRELAHGVMILVAGFLLLIPGFVSDIFGLLLFLPPVRDLGWRLLRRRMTVVGNFAVFRSGGGPQGGRTIDLDSDDYSRRAPPGPFRDRLDDRG